ncbi:Aste57867_15724 [Aphanomyces stellatus]|uniref:Aste57867_15724 protein n=1 Tax=Aphanomyces stellatus TaxID=120398 RepID=A0A485L4R8_9STRA|nr:hypothetical protein As57867_015668 [Aphanomyces stellatus]VFT92514.1 Aste57867_15724 [Aphanomyces stellatus]
MEDNRRVWFVLVDDKGQAYMGMAAHVVNIPSDSVIAEFKDAVKEKCDRQGDDLKGILSFKLHVYANLDELHKENPVPLEEDSAIGTFGLSKKGALYVVVPSHDESSKAMDVTVKESDDKDHLKELTYYQQRGRLIQDNCKEVCDAILNKVEEFYALTDLPLPFICVEGSSGMGKSQLAFALQGRRPYFYWIATPIGVDSQQIYKNFASISRRFDYFVGLDDPRTKREDAILNSMSSIYEDGELWTYGFIRSLLDYCNSGNFANGRCPYKDC